MNTDADEPLSFETDVKPLFSESDRDSMEFAFDLWSYEDVSAYAAAILDRLADGTMPCDGAWPQAQVDLFRRWTQSGMPGSTQSTNAASDPAEDQPHDDQHAEGVERAMDRPCRGRRFASSEPRRQSGRVRRCEPAPATATRSDTARRG